jgi:2-dehydropantoate 2-reductase
MRVAVVGAGAVGAYVGASLARGGVEVTLIARGAQLAALRERGVRVLSERGDFTAHPAATDDFGAVGAVDVVILAVKAHQIAAVAGALPALFGAGTAVVAMQNGIPWWYFQGNGGPFDGRLVRSIDADGSISATIETRRIVGCVVYAATEIEAPGVVRHIEGTRFSLGDPARGISERTERIAQAFVAGGLKAPVEADLRPEIWFKVLGNATLNPISALTRATLVDMCSDPGVAALAAEMMHEMVAVAAAHGVTMPMSVEKRIDGARRVGAHKTSMLQDLEAGKALEIEAMTGAVLELGELAGVATPATRHVYALTKLLERTLAPRT